MPMPYDFAYAVSDSESSNDYERKETSDGTTVVGSYRVLLPDTRIQVVTYRAGPHGFESEVSYIGEAVYPEGPVAKAASTDVYAAAPSAPAASSAPAAESYAAPAAYPAPVAKSAY